ncbi:MAG: DUF3784 domain-containing protein [Xanthomonadaceae bacterium]|jgi:hypothetical protein|nr:DUF3784 domain-containing protein [Xanthomonadaceae bacterium]
MPEKFLAALVLAIAAIPLFAIGWRFRSGKALHLLAGVDPNKVRDKAGLARHAGNGLIHLGLLQLGFGVAVALLPETMLAIAILAFVALVSVLIVRLVSGMSRFSSPP